MTDRERQTAEFLTSLGFEYNGWAFKRYRSSLFEQVSLDDEGGFEYRAAGKAIDLPAILSPLTLEMVEKAADEVWSEFKAREDLSVEARDAGIVALERLEALLRQQMGGGQG